MNSIFESKYTKTLREVVSEDRDFIRRHLVVPYIPTELYKSQWTFEEMFYSKFMEYEICVEDTEEWGLLLENKSMLIHDYYNTLLKELAKEYDVDKLIDTNSKYDDITRDVTLPNSITSKEINKEKRYSDGSNTTTNNLATIEMREKYLKSVRNIYEMYCNEFWSLFIDIY